MSNNHTQHTRSSIGPELQSVIQQCTAHSTRTNQLRTLCRPERTKRKRLSTNRSSEWKCRSFDFNCFGYGGHMWVWVSFKFKTCYTTVRFFCQCSLLHQLNPMMMMDSMWFSFQHSKYDSDEQTTGMGALITPEFGVCINWLDLRISAAHVLCDVKCRAAVSLFNPMMTSISILKSNRTGY